MGQVSKIILASLAALLLGTCSKPPSLLQQVLQTGELRVVTLNSPSTYYLGANGPQGPEFDLVAQFAAELGVGLHIYSVPTTQAVLAEMAAEHAHIAAAGLANNTQPAPWTRFGPSYQTVKEHLVYRQGTKRPRTLSEANTRQIQVASASPGAMLLRHLRTTDPELSWVEVPGIEAPELLYRLSQGEFDYTVADSNKFSINQAFHPNIRIAFDLNTGKSLCWLINDRDASLGQRVTDFFAAIDTDGRLATTLDRYYTVESNAHEYFEVRHFIENIKTRLVQYRDTFKEAASLVGMEWRLLAAIGYQESHWIPDATSPTGVRGIMMLTEETSRALNITDRLDPRQSIIGGARYYISVRNRMPARITEPDRTAFALASYNMGIGHIEDARILTQADGKNPDLWQDVRQYLPLLTQEKWYTQTKWGYARGWEPVRYVDRVRLYASILDWAAADGAFVMGLGDQTDAAE